MIGLSYGCKSTPLRTSTQQKRNDKQRKAMCLVRACCPVSARETRAWDVVRSACGACKFGEQFGELACGVLVGANVRSGAQMCGERAAECVRCVREYPTSLVGYSIRYDPHATSKHRAPAPDPPSSPVNVPSARQKRPHRPINRPSRHRSFDLPLQAVALQ